MAYEPTEWQNDAAPDIDADNLNKLEKGVQAAAKTADDAKSAAAAAKKTADAAAPANHTHSYNDLTDKPTIPAAPTADTLSGATDTGKAVMKAEDAAAARKAIGAGTSSSDTKTPAGTYDQLVAGTDETARAFTAKDIKAFVDARIKAVTEPPADGGE